MHLTPWVPLPDTLEGKALIRELNRRLSQREVFWRTVLALPVRTVSTGSFSLRGDDGHVRIDAGAGEVVVTLPRAEQSKGFLYVITKVDAGPYPVTIHAVPGQTIGAGSGDSMTLGAQEESVMLMGDGVSCWDRLTPPLLTDNEALTFTTQNGRTEVEDASWMQEDRGHWGQRGSAHYDDDRAACPSR